MNKPNSQFIALFLGIGFLIWLAATLAFRFAGQYFFITESPLILAILYLAVIPLLVLISVIAFKKFKLSGFENVAAGVLLVLPGMIIDTFVIQFFKNIFPNMPSSNAATFGSWLMWAYSVVLLTSIIIGFRKNNILKKSNPVIYFEIPVTDIDRAIGFYEAVFSFKFAKETIDHNEMALFPFAEENSGISGALAKGEIYKPTKDGALIYFETENIDETMKLTTSNGGQVLYPKTDNGIGYVAEFEDTEGNRIALSQSK